MLTHLKTFLLGGNISFDEGEEYLQFRFRFLFALLLFGMAGSVIFIVGNACGASPLPPLPLRAIEIHFAAMILLCAALFGRKLLYIFVAWAFICMSLGIFMLSFLFEPGDELRIIWFFISIPASFLLLGRRSGLILSVLAIGAVAIANTFIPRPFSLEAMTSAIVGLLYMMFFFSAYSSKSISFFERMITTNSRLRVLAADLATKNTELELALQEVKTLRGVIPICAWCKNVRNDSGLYEAIDAYFTRHLEADFSHTICPDCMKTQYPAMYEKKMKEGM